MYVNGLGKPRSRLGKWLDDHHITQRQLSEESGVSLSTINRMATMEAYKPSYDNAMKVLRAIRAKHPDVIAEDFWG